MASKKHRRFQTPNQSIGPMDAESVGELLSAVSDMAVIVDDQGTVRDMAFGKEELSRQFEGSWVDQQWIDKVTVESRPKVEALMRDAAAQGAPRWRHVNHPVREGADVPILYSAIRMGSSGHTAIFGRDLRDMAQLQQRLVKAQESMERDYARARTAEARYRMLFHVASEAVLIVDALSRKVLEINPAAGRLLGVDPNKRVGKPLATLLQAECRGLVSDQLTRVLNGADPTPGEKEVHARAASGDQEFLVLASVFRQEKRPMLLVRLLPQRVGNVSEVVPRTKSKVLALIERSPDGFVVTDADGLILAANGAFLDLADLATEDQARGQSVDRWLGRPGVDVNVLLTTLRQRGTMQLFSTLVRGEYGGTSEVEISGVSAPSGDDVVFGFTVREVGQRLSSESRIVGSLPRSLDQIKDLVGRVTLKELIREATDLIERLCIEAALELSKDNRASAAEMLGLSRQSLYVKMRRYGLGDLSPEPGDV
jgi:transcriptional regulator PpsR